jgi:hypothetical protein
MRRGAAASEPATTAAMATLLHYRGRLARSPLVAAAAGSAAVGVGASAWPLRVWLREVRVLGLGRPLGC